MRRLRRQSPGNFNPRSPRRERRSAFPETVVHMLYFNPRSPRRERRFQPSSMLKSCVFQSTLPSQGATNLPDEIPPRVLISIHAPLAGSDGYLPIVILTVIYFNPRSPRRERRGGVPVYIVDDTISIHAPLAGSDGLF